MIKIDKKKLIMPVASLVLAVTAIATAGVISVAHADTTTTSAPTQQGSGMQRGGTPPAAVGTVTAVSGDTITLTDQKNSTTYSVDATDATITKRTAPVAGSINASGTTGTRPAPTTITVSQVAVGDTLMVQGTVSGTNITATKIEDGVGGMGRGGAGMRGPDGGAVQGTVTAVNGNTVTITGKNGTTYTVDASNSTVGKFETIPVSSIQVGDSVGVQGTVSGDSVTAKSIMDGMPIHAPAQTGTTSS